MVLESVTFMRYGSPSGPLDAMRDFVRRGGAPVTLTLLTVSILTFLANFFTAGAVGPFLRENVAFSPLNVLHAPWTLLTYPVDGSGSFLSLLLSGFFFYLSGSSLERGWGSVRFTVFFFALTAISALSLLAGFALLHSRELPLLAGFMLPLSGLIVAFCMLNPEQTVVLYFFPIKAKYVAWIVTGLTYFNAGEMMEPVLGLFACGGLLAAFLYVRFGRQWADIGSYTGPSTNKTFFTNGPDLRPSKPTKLYLDGSPPKRSPFDVQGRWRDYQERKRLEKLWKNSGFSDTTPEWRDDEGRKRR